MTKQSDDAALKFGVCTFLTDEGLSPTQLARALEERGFDSLFVGEHTHMPVHGATPPDTDLPRRDYYRADSCMRRLAGLCTGFRMAQLETEHRVVRV